MKELEKFVETLLRGFEPETCSISTDEIVFEPTQILSLFARHSIQVKNHWELIVGAEGQDGIKNLLVATLSDWVDFYFILEPETFAIYADHDEYCTFYAKDDLTIGRIKSSLVDAGFKPVDDYLGPHSMEVQANKPSG